MTTETNISTVAMLMRLSISRWGASQKDQKESKDLCVKKNAKKGAANVVIQLIPKTELKEIDNASFLVKKIWHRYTLPWIDDGVGILPAKSYEKCSKEIIEAINYFNQKVDDFINRWPRILENTPPHLGEFLKNNPLPSIEAIRNKFSITVSYQPIPQASDFKTSLYDDAVAEIRRSITNSVNNATQNAMTSLYEELYKLVSKIKETTALKDKIFRDSLISNLKEFCERLPNLNITNDIRLKNLSKECKEQLATIDPQDLRENKYYRERKSKKADEIMKKIRKIDLDLE